MPVRLWLFGLVSLTEMQMLRVIQGRYPPYWWRSLLTQNRIDAATKIFEKLRKQNEEGDLSDYLLFGDKATIFRKDKQLYSLLKFEKKGRARGFFNTVRKLRNALAHSNDILSGEWSELAEVVTRLEVVLGDLENARAQVEIPPMIA